MEHEIDRIECAIRHIESSLDVDPWACEIAVHAMQELIKMTRGWTSVGQQELPEDGVMVWVTIKGHDVIRCEDGETLEQAVARISKMRRVSEGFWCDDDKTWYNAGGYPMMVQPVAWMPMEVPEPYRGVEK